MYVTSEYFINKKDTHLFGSVLRCIRLHTDTHTTCPCPLLDRHSHKTTPDVSSHPRLQKVRNYFTCVLSESAVKLLSNIKQVNPILIRTERFLAQRFFFTYVNSSIFRLAPVTSRLTLPATAVDTHFCQVTCSPTRTTTSLDKSLGIQ